MSCLMLSELPLADQVAIELAVAAKLAAKTRALLTLLNPPAEPAIPPCMAPSHDLAADGFNSLFHAAEDPAMVETQVTNHPPLQVCFDGHRPRMYRAAGNCVVVFYVECSLCGVRSPRMGTADDAANRWALRDVTTFAASVPMAVAS